jgi:hypothetical protein
MNGINSYPTVQLYHGGKMVMECTCEAEMDRLVKFFESYQVVSESNPGAHEHIEHALQEALIAETSFK